MTPSAWLNDYDHHVCQLYDSRFRCDSIKDQYRHNTVHQNNFADSRMMSVGSRTLRAAPKNVNRNWAAMCAYLFFWKTPQIKFSPMNSIKELYSFTNVCIQTFSDRGNLEKILENKVPCAVYYICKVVIQLAGRGFLCICQQNGSCIIHGADITFFYVLF